VRGEAHELGSRQARKQQMREVKEERQPEEEKESFEGKNKQEKDNLTLQDVLPAAVRGRRDICEGRGEGGTGNVEASLSELPCRKTKQVER